MDENEGDHRERELEIGSGGVELECNAPRQEARQGRGREACIVHSGETVKERWHGSAMGGMEAGPTE